MHAVMRPCRNYNGAWDTGNEPEVTEATWKLPVSISQQKGLDAQSSSVESAAAITSADEEVPGADGSRY